MRVLHVIDELGLGGGAEHSLAVLLPMLRDRGVDSSVACLVDRPTDGLQAKLQDDGFDVEGLPRGKVGRLRGLRRLVRARQPDLVHATLIYSCLTTRLALAGVHIARVDSLVNTSYDPIRTSALHIPPWKMRTLRAVDGFTAQRLGGHFHVISETVSAEAQDVLNIDPVNITLIPRGRDPARMGERSVGRSLDVRRRLGIDPDAYVLLNVGRQDHQKAQDDLVRAFALVRRSHPDTTLLLAGRPGDATGEINRAIHETGTTGFVKLLGHRDDVADLCAAADVFVFPSLYEGLGCALLEAMALGVPIVGSDAAAIREVLRDGRLGCVVQRGDVPGLAGAITGLLDDVSLRQDLGSRARREFEERYDLNRVADSTVTMYEEVLSRHGR